jgi:zinc transporter ZupT
MTSFKKALGYGFLTWLLPFIVGFLLFPIHESHRPLFESIMPVVVAGTSAFFAYYYLKRAQNPKAESVKLGILWLIINLVIDLALFLPPSPMQISFLDYLQDIGLTYLMIPIITLSIGQGMKK